MNFHTQTIDKTLLSLQTDSVGLDTVEASKRQKKYGLMFSLQKQN